MSYGKTIQEVMVRVSKYPHVPYWCSISRALQIVKICFCDFNKYYVPMVVLVLDDKYNLVGILTLKDILGKIEEAEGAKDILETPVGEAISPPKIFVQPGDAVTKAAKLMTENKLDLLPVLDEEKKFVGLVRMMEIFDELIDVVLKKESRNCERNRSDNSSSALPEAAFGSHRSGKSVNERPF